MKSLIVATAVAFGLLAAAPAQAGGVKIGILNCHVEGGVGFIIGSAKNIDCVFRSSRGGKEYYRGSIGKLGVDIGITHDTVLGWAVFAPGKVRAGALQGHYTGAGAEATLIAGIGANVLVGGFRKGINLQPISVQAQTGLNVAAGITSMSLRHAD